jgi:methionyl aminopeptidase
MIHYKKQKDIDGLRESGKILVLVLLTLKELAKEGIALEELNKKAIEMLQRAGATPAFLNYQPEGAKKPFPAAICASLNEQIVHGIPDKRILKNGDVLKIDFGVVYKNYITDAALTLGIGKISEEAQNLINTTKEALNQAIETAKLPNTKLGDIGWIIEHTAEKNGLSVVNELTGHGVGFKLHEDPTVYNYGEKGTGITLKSGLVIAIEPMISIGSPLIVQNEDDSFSTKDGSLSAHFEKTIAVTENGIEVLTPF